MLYSSKFVEHVYLEYNKNNVDDVEVVHKLLQYLTHKQVLILASGRNVSSCEDTLKELVKQN